MTLSTHLRLAAADLIKNEYRRACEFQAKKIATRYLKHASIKKLQIGSGSNVLPGWLNTDLTPTRRDIAFMDATKKVSVWRLHFRLCVFGAFYWACRLYNRTQGSKGMLQSPQTRRKNKGHNPRPQIPDATIRHWKDRTWTYVHKEYPKFVLL